MSRQQLEKFATSSKMKVYGQVRANEDARRKKTSMDNWGSLLSKRLSSTAKLALVGCVIVYSATVGYNAFKSLETIMNNRIQTIESVYQSMDSGNQNGGNLNIQQLKGSLGR